jgi:hypothetical protein
LTKRNEDAILLGMQRLLMQSVIIFLFVGVGFSQKMNAARPLTAIWSQTAMSSDPIVGNYDNVRYGTTFKFEPDGTIVGADGVGDGTWHAMDPGHHTYMVKIRPSTLNSPDRYESWTLTLEKGDLTQDKGHTTVFSRAK